VPDDVPLVPAQRTVSSGWWQRYPVWDAYFAVAAAGTAGLVATARPRAPPLAAAPSRCSSASPCGTPGTAAR
jgi:hypothetical protein